MASTDHPIIEGRIIRSDTNSSPPDQLKYGESPLAVALRNARTWGAWSAFTDTVRNTRKLYNQYAELHAVCPRCGSDDICMTCVGFAAVTLEEMRDPNQVSCCSCGWSGIGHDLVPEKCPDQSEA